MGWIAYTRENQRLEEGIDGRPVWEGEQGELLLIAQEDFGHKVAVDLILGVILIEYDDLVPIEQPISDGEVNFYISNPKVVMNICDETTIVGELLDRQEVGTNEEGMILYNYTPLIWRPIWFTRVIGGVPTKVIGAQTTMPEMFGGHNVKKLVMLFEDGRIGIA